MNDLAPEPLADLYRRSDGTMRQCNRHNTTERCNVKQCRSDGCDRANEILRGATSPVLPALESLPTRVVRLERENERLRAVIRQVADISPKSGGVGQIVRDEMRLWK